MNENEPITEDKKKYEKNFLLFLSQTKTYVFFGILNIGYRIILFIVLMACVYTTTSDTTSSYYGGGYYNDDDDRDYDYKERGGWNNNIKQKDNINCLLKGCEKCNLLNACTSCFSGLEPIYRNNKIIECHNPCQTGKGNKCLTCYETKNECKTCNPGYTLTSSGECIT